MYMFEVDEWTIKKDGEMYLVYPTEQGERSFDSRYFGSEIDAVNFAAEYAPVEKDDWDDEDC